MYIHIHIYVFIYTYINKYKSNSSRSCNKNKTNTSNNSNSIGHHNKCSPTRNMQRRRMRKVAPMVHTHTPTLLVHTPALFARTPRLARTCADLFILDLTKERKKEMLSYLRIAAHTCSHPLILTHTRSHPPRLAHTRTCLDSPILTSTRTYSLIFA